MGVWKQRRRVGRAVQRPPQSLMLPLVVRAGIRDASSRGRYDISRSCAGQPPWRAWTLQCLEQKSAKGVWRYLLERGTGIDSGLCTASGRLEL